MAVYKVPQDVEAEDKLIGPFTFRQFIYLIIVVIALFLCWALGQVFIGLVLIPLPFVIFFGALALPLRKDQPMEVYLTAVIKFYIKPRIRLWNPDGSLNMVTITAPETIQHDLTKGYGAAEAQQRLSYLAQIVDTQGWASRGVTSAPANLSDTVFAEAQNTTDVMDESGGVVQNFDDLITREDTRRRQVMRNQFQQAAQMPASTPAVIDENLFTPEPDRNTDQFTAPQTPTPTFNPYPSSMHQHVVGGVQPRAALAPDPAPPVTTQIPVEEPPIDFVTPAVSPDTIRLANNKDLTISAIAREAHRLEEKDGEEVIISLR
ncbi:MAG TPA: PrgI family protein [Candidatus Nitrosotenuis sp.]|nr:PrgI family protein [Candidatus Nitrosotenuis sp.]